MTLKTTLWAALSVAMATIANASTINVSTGLDSLNNLITVGNTPDAHWTVSQGSGGAAAAKVVDASNTGGAFFAWAANGPSSSWITVDPNSLGNGSPLPTYYRTFTLTAAQAAIASISGVWGIDDGGELRLNGNLLSSSPGNYSVTAPFAAGSVDFTSGLNTLTITMTTSDDFLEAVRLTGNVNIPDSGSTLALLGLALSGVVAVRRKLKS